MASSGRIHFWPPKHTFGRLTPRRLGRRSDSSADGTRKRKRKGGHEAAFARTRTRSEPVKRNRRIRNRYEMLPLGCVRECSFRARTFALPFASASASAHASARLAEPVRVAVCRPHTDRRRRRHSVLPSAVALRVRPIASDAIGRTPLRSDPNAIRSHVNCPPAERAATFRCRRQFDTAQSESTATTAPLYLSARRARNCNRKRSADAQR